ncbi:lysosomal-trafficking regulator isoform X1, partial [Clarias magur]
NSKDCLDLLNFAESPDQSTSTPLLAEQMSEENSITHPAPFQLADMRCFQKDLLKLMMEGLKIGL